MPVVKLIKKIPLPNGQLVTAAQMGVLLRENDQWVVLDPENNNELIKGASTAFIRHEVEKGRIIVDQGWDIRFKHE